MEKYIKEVITHITKMYENEIKNSDKEITIYNHEFIECVQKFVLIDFRNNQIDMDYVIFCFEYLKSEYESRKQHFI